MLYQQHLKKIIYTGGLQLFVQIANLLCGILVIRFLSIKEYAYYTLANTVLGIMTLLSDGGISSSVMAQSGSYWHNKEQVAKVINTGFYLRRRFSIVSLAVALPILIFLLFNQKAELLTIVLISLSIVPAFYASISDSILEILPKLSEDLKKLQFNQFLVAVLRLIFTLSTFIFPFTALAMLCNGIPRIYGNKKLLQLNKTYGYHSTEIDIDAKKEILKVVKRILPSAIFYTLSGQITIWIISIVGSQKSLAQIGALGRLSMILNVLSILVSILVVPKFAKAANNKKILMRYYIAVNLILSVILGIIILFVYLFPNIALMVLGKTYLNLNTELLLSVVGSCIGLLGNTCFSLFIAKGWAMKPLFLIPINILIILVGVCIFPVETLRGALLLNLFTATGGFLINNVYFLYKIWFLEE